MSREVLLYQDDQRGEFNRRAALRVSNHNYLLPRPVTKLLNSLVSRVILLQRSKKKITDKQHRSLIDKQKERTNQHIAFVNKEFTFVNYKKAISEFQKEQASFNKKIKKYQELEKKIEKKDAEIEKKDNKIVKKDNEIGSLHNMINSQNEVINKKKNQIIILKEKMSSLQLEIERTEVENLRKENNDQTNYIKTKENDLLKVIKENLDLENKYINLENTNKMLASLIDPENKDKDEEDEDEEEERNL
ncbi:hypothetical protein C2G38_2051601 [Gigaspora rosea]|uniref:Uncharacterized protein n=1 Tax=Gigaspora rosea TaxID=44941 RepID=A0A397TQW1_9GLOM|nr:hypothetical protein C2G38_2051601 [Gigaspora rosea]